MKRNVYISYLIVCNLLAQTAKRRRLATTSASFLANDFLFGLTDWWQLQT